MTTLGIDLGTASVLIYIEGRGIVLTEPSVVAIDKNLDRTVAVGEQAKQMLGKTPTNIVAIRPIRDGVIADYEVTEYMLRYFIKRVTGGGFNFFRPSVIICVPAAVTSVERRAVREATINAGAKKVAIIEEPFAAALGAGIDVDRPYAGTVIDIGGGTTDIAVISLGGTVVGTSVPVAGNKIDEAIVRYFKNKHNLIIGERVAEDLKILLGCSFDNKNVKTTEVRGRDVFTNLPACVPVSSADIADAIRDPIYKILDALVDVLENTPPELSGDIEESGIIMTGGGALLKGLDRFLTKQIGVNVRSADDPITCVAIGTGKAEARNIEWLY